MKLGIECVLRYKSFPQAAELWRLLAATHPALAGEQVDLEGDLIRFEDIEASTTRRLSRRGSTTRTTTTGRTPMIWCSTRPQVDRRPDFRW